VSAVRVLLGHHWRRHRAVLAALAGGMFLFHALITRVAPVASQTQAFQSMIQLMPPVFQRILGTAFFNARGVIAFGYEHPFVLLIMSVWAIRVSAGALAGEIGPGTMDLLGSRPVSRRAMVAAALVALLAGLGVIIGSGWIGTALGLATRPVLAVSPLRYLSIALGCWLLFAALGSVALAISALHRQGGGATAWSAGLVAASFALDYLARAWDPIHGAGRLSLFTYYRTKELYDAGVLTTDALVLLGVAAVATALAFAIFARRDL
jgi:ABC-2 type transport system permease protein